MVGQGSLAEDRRRAAGTFERGDQLSGGVLLALHRPQAGIRHRWPGAQEEGRRAHLRADDAKVAREVVALEAPAPWLGAAGRAKDRDIVELGVVAQFVLQRHNIEGFLVASLGDAGLEQRQGQAALVRVSSRPAAGRCAGSRWAWSSASAGARRSSNA